MGTKVLDKHYATYSAHVSSKEEIAIGILSVYKEGHIKPIPLEAMKEEFEKLHNEVYPDLIRPIEPLVISCILYASLTIIDDIDSPEIVKQLITDSFWYIDDKFGVTTGYLK